MERVEWLNHRSRPRLLLVSSDSCGPVGIDKTGKDDPEAELESNLGGQGASWGLGLSLG